MLCVWWAVVTLNTNLFVITRRKFTRDSLLIFALGVRPILRHEFILANGKAKLHYLRACWLLAGDDVRVPVDKFVNQFEHRLLALIPSNPCLLILFRRRGEELDRHFNGVLVLRTVGHWPNEGILDGGSQSGFSSNLQPFGGLAPVCLVLTQPCPVTVQFAL